MLILTLIIILPTKLSEACGPIDYSFRGYTFINPLILNSTDKAAPYFLSFKDIYEFYQPEAKQKVNDNLAEWHTRFCELVEIEDLAYVIYKAEIEDLDLLRMAIKSKNLPIPYLLQDNSFATYVKKEKCVEAVDYLIFSKKCEPHVVKLDPWSAAERDFEAMHELISEGRKLFRKTESPYMKLRFAYQIIRLAHYAKDYDLTLKLYDDLMPKIDKQISRFQESILKYWILGHKAGALKALGEHVKASYLFSLIFENCPSRRESAFRSFYINTDEEWIACEQLCKSDLERVSLYALRANASGSKAVEEMAKIYELAPKSHHLEVLLVQEILKMEKNLLGLEFNSHKKENKRRHDIPKAYAGDYVISLQAFARKCAKEKKVARPELWHLAEGYLLFLAGDNYQAQKTFQSARKEVTDKLLKEQLSVFELALKINSFQEAGEQMEEAVYDILKDNDLYKNYSSFPDFLRDKLASVYTAAGHPGKAFLSQHPLNDLLPNPDEEILRDLLLVMTADSIFTSFERLLTEDSEGNKITDALYDMQAVNLMQNYQWEAALRTYKNISREIWDDFGVFMPFRETINDCLFDCLYRRDTSEMFNRGELLEELLELESKARGRLEESARHYYRIGLGLYNMSYFGHSWQAMDFFRSGTSWSRMRRENDNVFSYWAYPLGNKEHLDVSRALYYFDKARQTAPEGSEIAARATFMAAKCDQKIYFMSDEYSSSCYNCIPDLPEAYLANFQRLKYDYSHTNFYLEVIRECKYFEAYALK